MMGWHERHLRHHRDHAGPPGAFGEMHEPIELEGVDQDAREAFDALRGVMHEHRRLMMKVLHEKGRHPGQAACLRQMIGREDGISQAELADKLGIAAPTVSRMVRSMERHGLVTRQTDSRDQRVTLIALTDTGRSALGEMGDVYRWLIDSSVGRLSAEERAELTRLLGKVREGMTVALER